MPHPYCTLDVICIGIDSYNNNDDDDDDDDDGAFTNHLIFMPNKTFIRRII